MLNEQLVSYIRENASKFPKQTLTQALMAQGWAVGDIAAAFSNVERERVSIPAGQEPSAAQTQDAAFLAEMEKRRREGSGLIPPTIVEGNTEIRPFVSASRYLDNEATSRTAPKGIIGLLIHTGLVKNEKQANIVMIASIFVFVGITAYLLL